MSKLSQNEITRMLLAWRDGNTETVNELFTLVYNELRRAAGSYMRRERSNHTLQPTALVNEVYLRLVNQPSVEWQNRAHFFGIAARLMRQVLIEYARAHNAEKRGGKQTQLALDDINIPEDERNVDLIALDEALKKFESFDPDSCRVVEMRFFGGLSHEEIAEVIGVSEKTVKRKWSKARAWLLIELEK